MSCMVLVVLKDRQPNTKRPQVWLSLLPRPLDTRYPSSLGPAGA